MREVSSTEIEADIHRLDVSLRQLKVQYDMFFAGALPREPVELRSDVIRLIKRYRNASIRKYAHRFHLNTLVSRFNTLSELWGKTIRQREEGPRSAAAAKPRGQIVTACRVHDPVKEQERLRELHAQFLEARKNIGAGGEISFSSFVRQLAVRAKKIRETSGCDEIELRIIVDDNKVQLKARPGS